MKRLILLRHAKSDWYAGAPSDWERPLNKRGVGAAKTMGRVMAAAGIVPEKVISSSAVRARTTVELAIEAGDWECHLEVTDLLYGVAPAEALQVAQVQPDTIDSVMLVGHEPTWSELAGALTGGGRVRVTTATAVGIEFEGTQWRAIGPDRGRIEWVLKPRLFSEWVFAD